MSYTQEISRLVNELYNHCEHHGPRLAALWKLKDLVDEYDRAVALNLTDKSFRKPTRNPKAPK